MTKPANESWKHNPKRFTRVIRSLGPKFSSQISLHELVARGNGEWIEVSPQIPFAPPITRHVGGPVIENERFLQFPADRPRTGVLCLDQARVGGHHGWVMTPSKEFVCDCSWYGEGFLQNSRIAHQLGPRRRSLRGLTLSLCSEFATINYGHVLYDVVPRIALFEQSGISYEQVDQILCNVGPAHRHLLAALNVPLEKVVWTDRSTTYQTERLITTTFPHIPRIIDPSSAQLIRARIPAIPDGSNRRLYIPREKRRRVANEQDLMLILDRRGFEVLNPAKSSTATRSAFAAAEIVVGSHGTGLADIVFGTPGAQLLELLPAHHAEPYFLAAAAAVGVGHRYVTVEGANHDDSVDPRKGQADVIVDLDVFERALDELISELP